MRWGIEQADKDGVPIYVEATPQGASLYGKLGFEIVEEIDFSMWIRGGGEYNMSCMLKKPGSIKQ